MPVELTAEQKDAEFTEAQQEAEQNKEMLANNPFANNNNQGGVKECVLFCCVACTASPMECLLRNLQLLFYKEWHKP